MLQMTPQRLIGFDVNVTYAQPHSRTTYANNVKCEKFDAVPKSILKLQLRYDGVRDLRRSELSQIYA